MIAPEPILDPARPVAVFDFDGTLTRCDSLPYYLRYVARQRAISWLRLLPALGSEFLAYRLGLKDAAAAKAAMLFRVLKGLDAEQIEALSTGFATELRQLLLPEAMQSLRKHQAAGHYCILLSASIEPALRAWAAEQSFDLLIGTRLAYDAEGVLLNHFDGANCKGGEKLRRLLEAVPRFREMKSFGYGDSKSDLPLLNACTHAFYNTFPDESFFQV